MKSLCKTYADRAAQLNFVTAYLSTSSEPSRLDETDIVTCPLLSQVKSLDEAIKLGQVLCQHARDEEISHILDSGIVIGSPGFIILSDRQLKDIQYWLRIFNPDKTVPLNLPQVVRTYNQVLKHSEYDYGIIYQRQ